jgi:hypothetical protein
LSIEDAPIGIGALVGVDRLRNLRNLIDRISVLGPSAFSVVEVEVDVGVLGKRLILIDHENNVSFPGLSSLLVLLIFIQLLRILLDPFVGRKSRHLTLFVA